jgi:putative ribosome biogenesis GTPase RsgA
VKPDLREFEIPENPNSQLSTINFFPMPAVLTLLRIKNLARVEELEWQMEPGFIAVTGETGAGKSIIIGGQQRYGCHTSTST